MQMRAGIPGVAGIAHQPQGITGQYPAAFTHQLTVQMGVIQRLPPFRIVEPHLFAAEAPIAYAAHDPVYGRHHRRAPPGKDIDAVVLAFTAVPGVTVKTPDIGIAFTANGKYPIYRLDDQLQGEPTGRK